MYEVKVKVGGAAEANRAPQIIFENEHFIAVDKPAGWLSVRSRLGDRDQRPCVAVWAEVQVSGKIWPVHRLDQEVSGVLLLAKNKSAHQVANSCFEGRSVTKRYRALSTALDIDRPGQEWTWTTQLVRGKKRVYEPKLPAGAHYSILPTKEAITRGKIVACIPVMSETADPRQGDRVGASIPSPSGATLQWDLWPLTGRSHQLRHALAKRGTPILGDRLYGSQLDFCTGEIALRAVELSFADSSLDRFGLQKILSVPERF